MPGYLQSNMLSSLQECHISYNYRCDLTTLHYANGRFCAKHMLAARCQLTPLAPTLLLNACSQHDISNRGFRHTLRNALSAQSTHRTIVINAGSDIFYNNGLCDYPDYVHAGFGNFRNPGDKPVTRSHGTRRQKVCHGTEASDLLTACLLKVISVWTRKVATCRLTVQTRYTSAEGMPRYRS
ncbi:hypothetical protein J6590_060178 [Homalodisca vitripennis]|nr:hypothetical protein J6590_060178 [Homalodisca vitripennis]